MRVLSHSAGARVKRCVAHANRPAIRRSALPAGVALLVLGFAAPKGMAAPAAESDRGDFNFHIRPLLSDRCFACHGPDEKARKGKLRLDTREGMLKSLEDGRAVVKPGDPDKSELVRRIHSTDPDELMPPPESNLKLSESEKERLKRWIAEGAEYRGHW